MKVNGSRLLDMKREEIWPLIFDPAMLFELLPGCDQLERISAEEYRGRMRLRIPSIAGSYQVYVKILEHQEPGLCRMAGEVSGPAGNIRGEASFTLVEEGRKTRLSYAGAALVSGPLAGMNSRFIESVAKTLISQGLGKLPALAREKRGQE
jgi:carbon monoxide dehydrogenase subunit G